MIDIPRNPRRKDLVVFGVLLLPFVAFVGWMLFRAFESRVPAVIAWSAGGALWLAFVLWPAARRRIYVGWILAVFPIGWTVSHVIVFVVYYFVVTPVGLVLRACGMDPMRRAFPTEEPTYWAEREPAPDQERYFRQF
jgi:ABC-type uncharacterized transport system permease subunit